jgi:hypothetical protein
MSSRPLSLWLLLSLLPLLLARPAGAKVFHTQKEALALAFPTADRVDEKTFVLTEEQLERIQKLARSRIDSRLVTVYTGWSGDRLLGYAHIDVHTVRTKPEGFLVVLGADGRVEQVRVLAFYEPLDYLPPQRWYDRFVSMGRDDALRLGRDVDAVSGATLSARAAAEGVRRMLAYWVVLLEPAPGG